MKKIMPHLLVLCLLTIFFFVGAVLTGHSPTLPSGDSLMPPSRIHLLGTDNLGVDIYAQISLGFFRSMAIGLVSAGLAFLLGGILGFLAGFLGGWVDHTISFVINVFLCVPQLPIMIVLGAFFGQSTPRLILIIAAFSWANLAKQLRAKTISVKNRDYVRLAKSYGGSSAYLLKTHMISDLLPLILVGSLGVIGRAIIQESSLAFLGLSDPLSRSWGMMIGRAMNFSGIYHTDYWLWWLLPPVLALTLCVLCLRLMAQRLDESFGKGGDYAPRRSKSIRTLP